VLFQPSRSRIHCSLREASSKDSITIECAMIAGLLPSAKAIGRASSRLAKSPVGHAITEGFPLGSGGSAKKLILIFMSQPLWSSQSRARQDEKNQDTIEARRIAAKLAKLPALSCCRAESAFSQVRQMDTNQIDPFALIGRRMDALKEFFANTRIVLRQLQN
jgi:hypothetical protein